MAKTGDHASELTEVEAAMGLIERRPAPDLIAREDIVQWMNSADIEVQAAVHSLIHEGVHYMKIAPCLAFEDYHRFNMAYYARCFRENPDGEWADTRYEAGWSFMSWFTGIWRDESTPRAALEEIRDWLEGIYANGGEEERICLITAVFEHLFEEKSIAKFFACWKDDPTMADAYAEAVGHAAYFRRQS